MSENYRIVLNLSDHDCAILKAARARLGATRAQVLRWALRWYALGGPWRHPDERLLAPLADCAAALQVGPMEREAI